MDTIIIDSNQNKYELFIPANPRLDQSGEVYVTCPICTPGRKPEHKKDKKLAVNLKIQHKPWRCNHCGEKGALITNEKRSVIPDFRPITKKFNLKKTDYIFKKSKKWRGISKDTFDYFKVKVINRGIRQLNVPKGEEGNKNKIINMDCLYFPSYDGDDLIDVQFRDRNKNFSSETGSTKIFFNINDIKGAETCLITEGRVDTISCYEAKMEIPACSVPNGVPMSVNEMKYFKKYGRVDIKQQLKLPYLDLHYYVFEEVEIVILGTDDDPAGIKLREELARRIGKNKCKYIQWSDWKRLDGKPCKDANDLLYETGSTGPDELKFAWKKARSFPISGLIRVKDVLNDILYERDNGKEKGLSFGFTSVDPHLTIMPGHLFVLNGFRNMGKTAFALQIALQMAILHNWKTGLYMPENYPVKRLVDKIVQMLLGKSTDPDNEDNASVAEIKQAVEFINEYIFIVHEVDRQIYTHLQLRDKAEELIHKYGIKMFIKDPWNRVRQNRQAREQPFDYLDRELSNEAFFAEQTNITWMINAHPKTPDIPKNLVLRRPSDHELYGGEVWGSKAHEIATLHRESTGADNNDAYFYVDKTKDHEIIGIPCPSSPVHLKFDRKSQRFYEEKDENFRTGHILDKWKHGIQKDIGF